MKTPNGWKKVKFGEVVTHVKERIPNRAEWTFDRYISGDHIDNGEIRITRSSPIEGNEEVIGSAFHMRFKPGQVLYVTRRGYLRKCGIVDTEGICSNVTFTMEADETKFLQSLLPFLMQTESFVEHATSNAHGSTNPFLNWKDIAKYEFLLPPLEEQKKISEVLWEVEKSYEKIELLTTQYNLFKRKFLKDVFRKNKYPKIKLGEITENLDGKRVPIESSKRVKGQIPYYGATGMVDYVKDYLFDEELLLVGEDGADWSANANTSFIIRGKSWVNNHAHVLRCKSIDITFLNEYLNSSDLRIYVVGTTRGKLTKKDLMNIEIPLPDKNTLKRIVQNINVINNLIKNAHTHKESLKNLRNKLSNELLKGELRLK